MQAITGMYGRGGSAFDKSMLNIMQTVDVAVIHYKDKYRRGTPAYGNASARQVSYWVKQVCRAALHSSGREEPGFTMKPRSAGLPGKRSRDAKGAKGPGATFKPSKNLMTWQAEEYISVPAQRAQKFQP